MLGVLWSVGKWLVATAAKVILWSIAHPVTTLLIGAGLAGAGQWLVTQPWSGAAAIGGMVRGVGIASTLFGLETWVGGKIAGWLLGKVAPAVGRFLIPDWFRAGMGSIVDTVYGVR